MMKRTAMLLAISFLALAAAGQFRISGVVVEESGGPLAGTNLLLEESGRGTASTTDGSFSFTDIPAGIHHLVCSFVGFETLTREIRVNGDMYLGEIVMQVSSTRVEEVMVTATRAGEDSPVAHTDLDREEIESGNFGQDVPYLLSMTPSLVTTSDAGHGIGYTAMRIRGTDASRINVTINGIPLNDAESHAVYWVDLPDVASSVDNIQVQRGVGTSTNGAAAFGASVNLMTRKIEKQPYATYDGNYGSFRSYRNSLSAGTGLLGNRFSADFRLSGSHSDGYIDRSWTDLNSYYASLGYLDGKTMVKFITFSGREELYQAWNGVPSYLLGSNRTYNELGRYTDATGDTLYYDNQIDHYRQDHYQLHFTHEFSPEIYMNAAAHYTAGAGYYEEYREDESLASYQMEDLVIGNDTITQTDLIRRKWLDNDFYGMVGGLHYENRKVAAILGGGWNRYDGDHFGTVIWARYPGNSETRHRWYESRGLKTDWNTYLKATIGAGERLSFFADLQLRGIHYSIDGIDDDLRDISQEHDYFFFNPKAGVNFRISGGQSIYLFAARASREPNRSNFVDADPSLPGPVAETLTDYEGGYRFQGHAFSLSANVYYMDYKNQLVLTGEINDVGSAVMTNVGNSFRAGIELVGGARITSWLRWDMNATFSSNKIIDYVGYVDNWDYWSDPENEPYQKTEKLGMTDLSFSPSVIAGSRIAAEPLKNLHLDLSSKYVGRQFIDNTSVMERSLDPYFINDVRISYAIFPPFIREMSFSLQLLNLFNVEYESNAWVYRYFSGGQEGVIDGYYPQAGVHVMAGIKLGL
jgi:iron complex outermembrane receptor protein